MYIVVSDDEPQVKKKKLTNSVCNKPDATENGKPSKTEVKKRKDKAINRKSGEKGHPIKTGAAKEDKKRKDKASKTNYVETPSEDGVQENVGLDSANMDEKKTVKSPRKSKGKEKVQEIEIKTNCLSENQDSKEIGKKGRGKEVKRKRKSDVKSGEGLTVAKDSAVGLESKTKGKKSTDNEFEIVEFDQSEQDSYKIGLDTVELKHLHDQDQSEENKTKQKGKKRKKNVDKGKSDDGKTEFVKDDVWDEKKKWRN